MQQTRTIAGRFHWITTLPRDGIVRQNCSCSNHTGRVWISLPPAARLPSYTAGNPYFAERTCVNTNCLVVAVGFIIVPQETDQLERIAAVCGPSRPQAEIEVCFCTLSTAPNSHLRSTANSTTANPNGQQERYNNNLTSDF